MVVPRARILLWAPSSWAALLLRGREEKGGSEAGYRLPVLGTHTWTWPAWTTVWIWVFKDNIKEVHKFSVPVIMLKSYISFPWQESSSEAQLAPSANASYGHHCWKEWGSHHFCCHGYCFGAEHRLVLGPAPVLSYYALFSMRPSCPFIHTSDERTGFITLMFLM